MMINCVIIDDEMLSRRVIADFVGKTDFLNLTESFDNPVDAINRLNAKNDIDLLFLDVEMPEMTGIDLMENLKNLPQIIIMSAKGKYAINAFEYDVVDYLLKPFTYARFIKAANKAYQNFQNKQEQNTDTFFVKSGNSFVRLKYEDIFWMEAMENYVVVNTQNEKYTVHVTMKKIEDQLPESLFMRVHRSYLVNLSKIKLIEDNIIVLKMADSTKHIPIARSYRTKLMERINLLN